MPIEFKKTQVVFREVVGVDEAEALLEWLQKKPAAKINLTACTHLHPANLQVLLAAKVNITAWPTDPGLCTWLETAFKTEGEGSEDGKDNSHS